jgi:hypothetical protein
MIQPRRIRHAVGAALLIACGCARTTEDKTVTAPPAPAETKPAVEKKEAALIPAEEVPARIAQFAVAELTADISKLPASEKKALASLIEAAKLLDPIFDRQVWARNPEHRAKLEQDASSEAAKAKLEYFDIMRGPWDRQDHHRPFAHESGRPKGGGFYPEDLTAEDFRAYVAAHPDKKEALEGLFTVVQRDGADLVAVPYSRAYKEWLESAAAKLREAAAHTKNASLKKFLELRAKAFLEDDYYESDKAWMDLESVVEVTIGPYETYEDELLGQKAAFEAFVTISDPVESKKLAKYKEMLPEMENHLPVPDEVKTKRGAESPIRVVDVVFTSGDARKSVQTIAFNLPNDERVRKEKGAKKVLLRNLIQTKFDRILRPIGEKILDPAVLPHLSADAFFHEVLFHELSHSLGPAFTKKDGKDVEVRAALESSFSPIEEAKADVMGAYNVLYMIERGLLPKDFREKLLASYFAGLFRGVRFGVAEAHGKGSALQINRYLEDGAATFDDASGKFRVDLDKLEKSITKLVTDICLLQHRGDKAAVDSMLAKYGIATPAIQKAVTMFTGIPVDIRPRYPLAN